MTRRDRWLPELEHGVYEGETPPSTYGHGVGAQLAQLREQRDEARAEVARLRRRVVELEDVAQVEEARRREGSGLLGLPLGITDRNGVGVRFGDLLAFDEQEWGAPGYQFVVRLEDGEVPHYSDIPQWCDIVGKLRSHEALMPATDAPAPVVNEERLYAVMRNLLHGPKRGGRG